MNRQLAWAMVVSLLVSLYAAETVSADTCGCLTGAQCATETDTHPVSILPHTEQWHSSCCENESDGFTVPQFSPDNNTLPFTYQDQPYESLPAIVTHRWQRFVRCIPPPRRR